MTSSAKLEPRWLVAGGDNMTLAEQKDLAHKLLQQLVGRRCTVVHDASGAPLLAECPDMYVSISHCRAAVAVAVAGGGAVGIDVECRRSVSPSLVARVCTDAEQASVAAAPDGVMAFLRLWTMKEAVLKCRRTGITGFGSMVEALGGTDCTVCEVPTGLDDVVAALATAV